MTETSLRKQLDRIVCADGVEDELVEIFTTAWEDERQNIGRGIAPKGTKTRAGLRAVYDALLDKIGAPDLTPSQQATVDRFGIEVDPYEECRSELHSWNYFTSQQVDSFWMRCDLTGHHDEHENSNTGAHWTDTTDGVL